MTPIGSRLEVGPSVLRRQLRSVVPDSVAAVPLPNRLQLSLLRVVPASTAGATGSPNDRVVPRSERLASLLPSATLAEPKRRQSV